MLFKIKGINSRTTNCMRDYTQISIEGQSMQSSHLWLICLQFSVNPLRKLLKRKIKMREKIQLLYKIQMQYKHHFCNNAQHTVNFFFFSKMPTEGHYAHLEIQTSALHFQFQQCQCSQPWQTKSHWGCSVAHYIHFLLLPLTLHSSHLTVLPFAPFTASQCLQYCPQNFSHFISSLLFISNCFHPFLSFPEILAQIVF